MPIALGELDLDEVLRYMGTPPSQAGPELRALAEECGRAVCAAARPRWAWRAFDIAEEEGGVRLSCGLLLPGRDLKAHLEGCVRAVVFCMTLGAAVDVLIRKTQSGDMLQGLALDCAADTAVEQGCDQIELELQALFQGFGRMVMEIGRDIPEAISLYRKMGYREIETLTIFADNKDTLCMEKELL